MGYLEVLIGLAFGWLWCYITTVRPLRDLFTSVVKHNRELVCIITDMKKRGFVRQFDFEQAKSLDPSENVRDY